MWAQSWGNIAKHVLPYPEAPAVDATPEMIKQVRLVSDFLHSELFLFTCKPLNDRATLRGKCLIWQTSFLSDSALTR